MSLGIKAAKRIYNSGYEAKYIAILPPSLDDLRIRVKNNMKVNTENVNKILENAAREIKEIEASTFFSHKIFNDDLETSYLNFKNSIMSIYPYFKKSFKEIEEFSDYKRIRILQELNNLSSVKKESNLVFFPSNV